MIFNGRILPRVMTVAAKSSALIGEEGDGKVVGCEFFDNDEKAVLTVYGAESGVGNVGTAGTATVPSRASR